MPDIRNLKVGQTLWTLTRRRMGNTTMRETAVHPVVVREIDPECKWVMASWNYNPPCRYYRRNVQKWRVKEPKRRGHNDQLTRTAVKRPAGPKRKEHHEI